MKKKGGKTVPNCVPKEEVQQTDEGIISTGIAKVKAGHYDRKANKSFKKAKTALGYSKGKSIAKGTSDEDGFSKHMKQSNDYERKAKKIRSDAFRKTKKFNSYSGNRNESVEEGRYPTWNKARVALNKDKKSGKKKDYKILSPAEFMKVKSKKESVEFNESISDLMEANLPINMLVGPGGVGGGKTYQQAGKEMMKDAWRALTGKQKRVIAKVHKLTQTDDELAKLYRDGWKGGGNSMKPGARKAFDARVKELLPNEQTRDYVAAWKSVRDKVKSAMKESVEHLEEKTFHANIGNKDYQKIRSASMRGNFNHKFSRKTNGDVAFNTKNPVTLTKDLEKLIDSGASSWSDILDIYGVHKKSKSVWPGQYAGGGAFQVKNK